MRPAHDSRAEAEQPPLRWGIVGCGDVVEKKSGPSILQSGGSRIVAVMRRDVDKARAFADAHEIPLGTADADAVIRHPEVDLVYVATPPAAHKPYVLAAAAAGKHVLVEKPMGLRAAEDREMIDACAAAGVELFVAYYRRFHPHVLKMKDLIDAGRIGRPVTAAIILIKGWPVQFLPSANALIEEAVVDAVETDVEGVTTRIMTAEHLVAIALQLGRAKDHARILQFTEAGVLDDARFQQILAGRTAPVKADLVDKVLLVRECHAAFGAGTEGKDGDDES